MTDQPAEPYPPLEPVEFKCTECSRLIEIRLLGTFRILQVEVRKAGTPTGKTLAEQIVGVCVMCTEKRKAREAKGS